MTDRQRDELRNQIRINNQLFGICLFVLFVNAIIVFAKIGLLWPVNAGGCMLVGYAIHRNRKRVREIEELLDG